MAVTVSFDTVNSDLCILGGPFAKKDTSKTVKKSEGDQMVFE